MDDVVCLLQAPSPDALLRMVEDVASGMIALAREFGLVLKHAARQNGGGSIPSLTMDSAKLASGWLICDTVVCSWDAGPFDGYKECSAAHCDDAALAKVSGCASGAFPRGAKVFG